jgi:hypothetical protein
MTTTRLTSPIYILRRGALSDSQAYILHAPQVGLEHVEVTATSVTQAHQKAQRVIEKHLRLALQLIQSSEETI